CCTPNCPPGSCGQFDGCFGYCPVGGSCGSCIADYVVCQWSSQCCSGSCVYDATDGVFECAGQPTCTPSCSASCAARAMAAGASVPPVRTAAHPTVRRAAVSPTAAEGPAHLEAATAALASRITRCATTAPTAARKIASTTRRTA